MMLVMVCLLFTIRMRTLEGFGPKLKHASGAEVCTQSKRVHTYSRGGSAGGLVYVQYTAYSR